MRLTKMCRCNLCLVLIQCVVQVLLNWIIYYQVIDWVFCKNMTKRWTISLIVNEINQRLNIFNNKNWVVSWACVYQTDACTILFTMTIPMQLCIDLNWLGIELLTLTQTLCHKLCCAWTLCQQRYSRVCYALNFVQSSFTIRFDAICIPMWIPSENGFFNVFSIWYRLTYIKFIKWISFLLICLFIHWTNIIIVRFAILILIYYWSTKKFLYIFKQRSCNVIC